jgi:BirA family transcriptional regulator, biotin operon repressor / biotin---[acetyl-CoA-carboxylase] ligase
MSVLLRPRIDPRRIGGIALVAGAAVREALKGLGGREIEVYWPNDLEFRGRKLGGILGEVRGGPPGKAPGDPGTFLALGIGLNLDLAGSEVPPELRGRISSLAEAGCRDLDPRSLAIRILERLRPLVLALEDGAPIPALVRGAIAGFGRTVRVRVPSLEPWTGRILGIGDEGELLVAREDGAIEGLRSAEVDYGPRP